MSEELEKVNPDKVVNTSRNPVQDLWIKFMSGQISKAELHNLIKRRCIQHINDWYWPKVVKKSDLPPEKEMWLTKTLLSHNKDMVEWLKMLLDTAELDMEQNQIRARIDKYNHEIYIQLERLRTLIPVKTSKKQMDF